MPSSLQDIGLVVIGCCVLLLAVTNLYLVWRLIKGVRFEDEKLDSIAAYGQQILSQQLTVRHIVSDPGFQSLLRGMPGPALAAAPATVVTADDAALDAAVQSATQLGSTALEMEALLGSLNDSTDIASWKAANQARINELLRSQGGLKDDVEQLQTLLTKANATILNLRAHSRQPQAGEPSAAHAKEVETLKAGIAARDTKIAAAEAVLKNEKHKFEEEKKRLNEKIADMQAAFDRTLVEKNFIEDAFIEETQGQEKPAT